MMGEHGNSQIVPWSLIHFGGKPLAELEENPNYVFDKDKVQEQTIKAG